MRLVLDSNEYIYAFGTDRKPECEALLVNLASPAGAVGLRVPKMVVAEIRRNLDGPRFKRCHQFWRRMGCSIDEDESIPFDLFASYLNRGFKPADAQIGAYAEWVRADFLISENRDFLALSSPMPFRVMKASAFLKLQDKI